ncbi:MAG TPA: hypothetical protein PLS21_03745 [Synergistales bacterium]|nr:hypothetical protein [Synergistaceae bacterium]HQO83089.1 hypothetical protein [Synergistales bacterium]HQQ10913.1 hypothetical protein [Synergistales bacterium]
MNSYTLELPCGNDIRTRGRGTTWILLCGAIVALLMGLVALRLYSLDLEYQLADIQRQIVLREEEQSRLEKDLAGLLNPTRVYSYARSELGMKASSNIGLVKVAAVSTGAPVDQEENRAGSGVIRKALVWLADSVSKKASARQ